MSSRNSRSVLVRFSVSFLLYGVFQLERNLLRILLCSRALQSDEEVLVLFTVSVNT